MQAVFAAGFLPCALEIADAFTLAAAGEYLGKMLAPRGSAHLLIDLDGQPESVAAEARALGELLVRLKAVNPKTAIGEVACEELWNLRRAFSQSLKATGLIKLNEDIAVPRGRLTDLAAFAETLRKKYRLPDCLLRPRGRRQHPREHHGGELPHGPRGEKEGRRGAR